MSDLTNWVRAEQVHLWADLEKALDVAIDGTWSMGASNLARRIVEAAHLVGTTPYGEVGWTLLACGVYDAVIRAGGLDPALPDEQEWQRLDQLMTEVGGARNRASIQDAYGATVRTIRTARETRWIAGGDE